MRWLLLGLVVVVVGLGAWRHLGASPEGDAGAVELLNVSYDPTRELWRDLNAQFQKHYQRGHGIPLIIRQSHGGSSSQARAVIEGLEADVVTLALWSDTNALHRNGLIEAGWESRLPDRSLPYHSTIVFVVRKGNPRQIHDWPDLVRDGVTIVTPSPRTSGNGKLSFLAAWGAVRSGGGSEKEAEAFVTELYRRVRALDTGARGAAITFAHRKIGDVHLTWENEALLEVREARGELEVVYPPCSIRAEPPVAVVDANVDRRGTRAAAEAYLQFLYTEEAQEIIARHGYRPRSPAVQARHVQRLPALELFTIHACAAGWEEAQQRFFADGGVFDRIYQPAGR
jgi:sulfate transport system substrate-binding protein